MEKVPLVVKGTKRGGDNGNAERGVDREKLLGLLQRYFGHSSFRGRQLEAIEAVLSGQDCFCLMPTGGGKSMCYTIPALVRPGIVLVVCPLIALMENQVSALKAQKIAAEHLSSTQGAKIKSKIYEQLESGRPTLRLLYVTPELIATPGFITKIKKLHGRGLLSLVAIDEAHCISSWGHDFRPSYRKLSSLRSNLPDVPILALTATAAKKVQDDIVKSLALQSPQILISSFNRPNIYYEVRYKDLLKNPYEDLRNLIKSNPEDCCIVYCHSRATCDEIGLRLSQDKISSRVYHAGLPAKQRSDALEQWSSGKVPVVIATVAFGMGIDRKDVRMVCHYNVPKSLEGFYQESGRAGRDGNPARSVIYYGLEDRSLMEFLARKPEPRQKNQEKGDAENNVKKNVESFNQMVQYCEEARCRRQRVLAHFGENVSTSLCNKTCDSCRFQSRVSACLEDLALCSSSKQRSSSYIVSSGRVQGGFQDPSEFWDDVGGESGEEISDSEDEEDDEATMEAKATVSKRTLASANVEKKVDALLRAERAFERKQGSESENSRGKDAAASDKRTINQAFRDACADRLKAAVLQASQRLNMASFDADAAGVTLEAECFQKYSKAGKPFYSSQVASTTRWLSTCSTSDLLSRVNQKNPKEGKVETSTAAVSDVSTVEMSSAVEESVTIRETCTITQSVQVSSRTGLEDRPVLSPAVLPPIPSFKDFLGKKKTLSLGSTSRGPSAPFKRPRRQGRHVRRGLKMAFLSRVCFRVNPDG
ncbi:hypothetical protein R1sor_021718 [Riccia sorocarpa]|uniref:ATP-dependent DNA helicase n=1 Tax=Riccia sorocarpa TaxID=122646 RepID=A0ABD3GJR7_9MARC